MLIWYMASVLLWLLLLPFAIAAAVVVTVGLALGLGLGLALCLGVAVRSAGKVRLVEEQRESRKSLLCEG